MKTDEFHSGPAIISAPYNAYLCSTAQAITSQGDPGKPQKFWCEPGHLEMQGKSKDLLGSCRALRLKSMLKLRTRLEDAPKNSGRLLDLF